MHCTRIELICKPEERCIQKGVLVDDELITSQVCEPELETCIQRGILPSGRVSGCFVTQSICNVKQKCIQRGFLRVNNNIANNTTVLPD